MEQYKVTYERNRESLQEYQWWRYGELPIYERLPNAVRQINTEDYTPTDINTRPFFRDLSKPLLVKNERNSYHFGYLVDNVRASEDFGGDNHIYMYYDSREEFYRLLQAVDITPYLSGKKIVFLLGVEELTRNYPLDFKKEYGIDYEAMGEKPLRVEEIQRIVVNSMKKTLSGNFFFAEVLDYHPNLLTLPGFGISDFGYLYKKLLKNRTVGLVCEALLNNESAAIKTIVECLFHSTAYAGILKKRPQFNNFMQILADIFPREYKPTENEWFVAIYLAYNIAIGRKLNDRIPPAIVYNEHGITHTGTREKKHIISLLSYKKILVIFRNPIIAIGSRLESRAKLHPPTEYSLTYFMNSEFLKRVYCLYERQNKNSPFTMVIRFEDLKLEPKATLESLCDFFDIPWSDTLLNVTCNGEEVAMYGDITTPGVRGFDTRPVYNKHEQVICNYDYERMSFLCGDIFKPWGYNFQLQPDSVPTDKEIVKMFQEPFKYEKFNYTSRNIKDSIDERKEMIDLVKKVLNKDITNLVPIPWLKPKAEFMQGKLYE